PVRCGSVPALRRRAGGDDRRAARPRRYPNGHAVESRRPLGRRSTTWVSALLPPRLRRRRTVVGPVDGIDHLRRGPAVRMAPTRYPACSLTRRRDRWLT